MSKHPNPDHDSTQPESSHNDSEPSYLRWVFIGGALAFVGLLAVSLWWPNLSERTKFFTGNLLNLVIGLAVIAQVLIYRKQRDIMRQQWQAMADSLTRTDSVIESMREQAGFMKTQAEAALHAAEMATGQLVAMNRSADLSLFALRPFVDIGVSFQPGGPLRFHASNSGKNRAIVQFRYKCTLNNQVVTEGDIEKFEVGDGGWTRVVPIDLAQDVLDAIRQADADFRIELAGSYRWEAGSYPINERRKYEAVFGSFVSRC